MPQKNNNSRDKH